jgi:hypothetical protein
MAHKSDLSVVSTLRNFLNLKVENSLLDHEFGAPYLLIQAEPAHAPIHKVGDLT